VLLLIICHLYIKREERATNHSPPSFLQVKNLWSFFFFSANILLRLHVEVEDVFPAGRRLLAVSGKREASDTRSRALQSGKPNTHCCRDPCYPLIQDMQWQIEGTRNQFNQAVQNSALLWRETFNLTALKWTHFMDPAILQTVDIQLFGNMGLLHTESFSITVAKYDCAPTKHASMSHQRQTISRTPFLL